MSMFVVMINAPLQRVIMSIEEVLSHVMDTAQMRAFGSMPCRDTVGMNGVCVCMNACTVMLH